MFATEKEKEKMHENSPLVKSLHSYFEKWRPELITSNGRVSSIKPVMPPPVRDYRLKKVS